MNCNYSLVNLLDSYKVFNTLIEGQKLALSKYGLEKSVITPADLLVDSGMFGVIASLDNGEIIGGARIYTRRNNRTLPLESEGSYLPEKYRCYISEEKSLCEVRGLWVSEQITGHGIGIKISEQALSYCYSLGFDKVVSTGQMLMFKYIGELLGFQREMRIPIIPFPDERFETIVAWHRRNTVKIS